MNEVDRNRIFTVMAAVFDNRLSLDVFFDEDLIPKTAKIDGEHLVVTLEGVQSHEERTVRFAIVEGAP